MLWLYARSEVKDMKKIYLAIIAVLVLAPTTLVAAFTLMGSVGATVTVSDPVTVNGIAWEVNWPMTNGLNPNLNTKSMNPCTQSSNSWSCGAASLHIGDYYSLNGWLQSLGNTNASFVLLHVPNATVTEFFSAMSGCPNSCTTSGSWSSSPLALTNGEEEAFSIVLQFNGTLTSQPILLQIGE